MWFEIQGRTVWGHDGRGDLWKVKRSDMALTLWLARLKGDPFTRHGATCTEGRSYSRSGGA